MYGVVLATMLTATTTAAPDWGMFHGCCGGGCWSSCHGCCGWSSCYGCCGYSSCYGCCGYSSCYGCCGYSSCYGCCGYSSCYGCCGYSSCYGCCGYSSCFGCCGSSSCFGCCGGCYGGVAVAPVYAPPPAPHKAAAAPTQGTVVASLPADAKLYADGQEIKVSGDKRTFLTPELTTGKDYFYILKAEMKRDGKDVAKSLRVVVRAGAVAEVNFGDLSDAAAAVPDEAGAAPAKVTVTLPEDAKLYVDGVACPLTTAKRSFETPVLQPGKAYGYTLKAEVVRGGEKKVETKQVELQAGKEVTVDFGDMAALKAASR
jgi:uncharacterized protein (TIGR03000 family)